jgi:hypothetical protein
MFAQSVTPQERPTLLAFPLNPDERITIDGKLDELLWQRAVPATNSEQFRADHDTLYKRWCCSFFDTTSSVEGSWF